MKLIEIRDNFLIPEHRIQDLAVNRVRLEVLVSISTYNEVESVVKEFYSEEELNSWLNYIQR